MQIIKASGDKVPFEKKHIEKSILRAGGSNSFAKQTARNVERKISKDMSTQKVLMLTLDELKKDPEVAMKYNLKRAIMELGPEGYVFEEFFAQILTNYGYKTKTGTMVKGKRDLQEIDIIAEKKKRIMIEAKYHNQIGIYTKGKVAMYTYARFLDINSNPKNKFDEPWLVTNTRCSRNAIEYGKGVGLKIIGWAYPSKGQNLQNIIEKKSLYPITVLRCLPKKVKEKLFSAKIILAKDLANHSVDEIMKKTELKKHTIEKLLNEAKILFGK